MKKTTKRESASPKLNANTEKRMETESKLLLAAIEIFSQHGYDGATTRMIAKKAGVNLTLITRYFGNKHGLLVAIVKQGSKEFLSKPLPYPKQTTLLDECLRYAETTFATHIDHTELIRIVVTQSLIDPKFAKIMRDRDITETPQNIIERMDSFKATNKNLDSKQMFELAEFLHDAVFSNIFLKYILKGESQSQCLDSIKTAVTAYVHYMHGK